MNTISTESTVKSLSTSISDAQIICSWVKACFAELVYSARVSQGISQAELSRRTGIDRTTLVKLEKRQRDPSIDVMILLIHALKLDFNLLDIINTMPSLESSEDKWR